MPESENTNDIPKPAENEIADYYDNVKKKEMTGHEAGIKKARNALFATAALFLIGEIISASVSGLEWTPMLIGVVAIEAGIFIALGLWTKTKPYTAIIVGLVIFILFWVLAIATVGIRGAYSGIVVKVIIISFLVSALKPAKAWEDLKKQ